MPKVVDVDERRNTLAAAAARVIARSGVSGATMREVAAEAGLTTGSLTHYFTDKRELLLFTLRASLEQRRHGRPRAADTNAASLLRTVLEGVLPIDESARLHWIVTIAFCAQAVTDVALANEQQVAYRRFVSTVTTLLERGAAEGSLASTNPRTDAERLIAVADGIALQALFDPVSWPAQRQCDHLEAMLGPYVTSPYVTSAYVTSPS
jgi:TetR/AcrR family transcriptional regulator, transcriptional repressor of bet genes